MTYIHYNKVNNISEYNLSHYILNYPKCTKTLKIHYYPILRVYINTRKGKAKFKNF